MTEENLYGLALCAGIGGLEMGIGIANPRYRTVAYLEREAFSAAILAKRMEEGFLDPGPIWSDLETFDPVPWRGIVSVISCGFPCQPWSAAGKRKKTKDSRWIWDSIARIICEIGPGIRYVFLENVPGISGGGLEHVLRTLAEVGLDAEWDLFRASDCGAPQKRERMFILGHRKVADSGNRLISIKGRRPKGGGGARSASKVMADSSSKPLRNQPGGSSGENGSDKAELGNTSQGVADPDRGGLTKHSEQYSGEERRSEESSSGGYVDRRNPEVGNPNLERLEGRSIPEREGAHQFPPWPPGPSEPSERFAPSIEPSVCRTSNGLANRVDRLRSCGNAVLPVVAAYAWTILEERSRS